MLPGVSLAVELLVVFVFTALLLRQYSNWKRQSVIVLGVTLTSWYFCFIIVGVLPLDVSLTFYEKCLHEHQQRLDEITRDNEDTLRREKRLKLVTHRPWRQNQFEEHPYPPPHNFGEDIALRTTTVLPNTTEHSENTSTSKYKTICQQPTNYVSEDTLVQMWRVVYWTAQALCWIILPIMQSYYTAGDFTVCGKIKTALFENALIYASYLLIFGLLLMYAAAKGITMDAEHFKVIGITASNTWGLFILVALLGYGLVELPRQVWLLSSQQHTMQKTYFLVDKLSSEKSDAEEAMRAAYHDVSRLFDALPELHPYRAHIETIMNKFPVELAEQLAQSEYRRARNRDENGGARDDESAKKRAIEKADLKYLVKLHKRAIASWQTFNRTQAQWSALIEDAVHMEDIQRNEQAGDWQFVHTSPTNRSVLMSLICTPTVEYLWYCVCKRPLLKALAVIMAILSGIVIWSECTFFSVHPTMSLVALFVTTAAHNYDYGYIEFYSLLIILYMSIAAYYTVFQLKIFEFYHLDPHHHTDSSSLLFSGMLLARLTPPLCLNYLGLIHLDSHLTEDAASWQQTAFTKFMGNLDVLPAVARGLNVYLPIWIVLLCAATWFRFGERCLHAIGIDQFVVSDRMTTEMCQAGKALVAIERNRRSRGPTASDNTSVMTRIRRKYDKGSDSDGRRSHPHADRLGGRRGFGDYTMQRIMARRGYHQVEAVDVGNDPIEDTAPMMDDVDDDEQGELRLDSMVHEDSYGDRRGVYRQVPRRDSTESDSPSRTPANLFDDL